MLSRDLLRLRVRHDMAEALWLRPSPALQQMAQALLQLWQQSPGASRAEIDEQIPAIIHGFRSQVLARGLVKLIADAAVFADCSDLREKRSQALDASAELLHSSPAADAASHRQQLIEALGPEILGDPADPQALYADLPQRARLQTAPQWTVEELIDHYNMALAQGLLLRAEELWLRIGDPDPGIRRRICKALRFQRLCAQVSLDASGELLMTISGPGAVLDQHARYGLQLANFLPHLCTAASWQLRTSIQVPRQAQMGRQGGQALLELNEQAPLRGHSRLLAYTPPELQRLRRVLADKLPEWELNEEAQILQLSGGALIIPDLELRHPDAGRWQLECFHRWHKHALRSRIAQISAGLAPRLLLAVDRSIAAGCPELAEIPQRHLLFRDYPSPSALKKLLMLHLHRGG